MLDNLSIISDYELLSILFNQINPNPTDMYDGMRLKHEQSVYITNYFETSEIIDLYSNYHKYKNKAELINNIETENYKITPGDLYVLTKIMKCGFILYSTQHTQHIERYNIIEEGTMGVQYIVLYQTDKLYNITKNNDILISV